MKLEIEYINLVDIKPYENNPRKNDKAVEVVAKSIKEFGFLVPIVLDDKNEIVAGHTRVKAAIKLGMDNVPAVYTEGLTKEQIKAFRIMDNKTNEYASWDDNLLKEELIELKNLDFDLDLTGFSELELDKLIDSDTKEVPIPEEVKYNIHIEDLYELENNGLKHYVYCGDATNRKDIDNLMKGSKVEMVFTDPPWNVDYGGNLAAGKYKDRKILNDSMSQEKFLEFLKGSYNTMNYASKEGAMTYVVMSAQEWGTNMLALGYNNYHWSSTIIWKKSSLIISRKDYHTQYEPIWYGWKGDKRLCALTDRTQSDVWEVDKPTDSKIHPTTKPIELCTRAIQNSSVKGNKVLDLFGGSGSTLIACEQTGRNCYMMELDEDYCSRIIQRWEELTGKTAKKISGNE